MVSIYPSTFMVPGLSGINQIALDIKAIDGRQRESFIEEIAVKPGPQSLAEPDQTHNARSLPVTAVNPSTFSALLVAQESAVTQSKGIAANQNSDQDTMSFLLEEDSVQSSLANSAAPQQHNRENYAASAPSEVLKQRQLRIDKALEMKEQGKAILAAVEFMREFRGPGKGYLNFEITQNDGSLELTRFVNEQAKGHFSTSDPDVKDHIFSHLKSMGFAGV